MTHSKPSPTPSTVAQPVAVEVTRQIGALDHAGLLTPEALRALAEDTDDRRLAAAFRRLADDLEAGTPLAEAIQAPELGFPEYLQALLEAGSHSRNLMTTLTQTLGDFSLGSELRRGLWVGLMYPLVVLALAILLLAALCAFLLGGMHSVFADFGIDLNWFSAQCLHMAQALSENGLWTLPSIAVLCTLLALLVRLVFTAAERRALLLRIPLIGPIFRYAALSDFSRVLAALLQAKLPMPRALPLAARAAEDSWLTATCQELTAKIESGQSLADALEDQPPFPRGFGTFLQWGETIQSPGQALRLAAGIFEERARMQARLTASFVKLLVLVLIIWWATIIIFIVFVPMLQMLWRFSY